MKKSLPLPGQQSEEPGALDGDGRRCRQTGQIAGEGVEQVGEEPPGRGPADSEVAELLAEPVAEEARAKMFVSHGKTDQILSFENAEDYIVPQMKRLGFDVRFEPFEDRHVFREEEINKAMDWFLG